MRPQRGVHGGGERGGVRAPSVAPPHLLPPSLAMFLSPRCNHPPNPPAPAHRLPPSHKGCTWEKSSAIFPSCLSFGSVPTTGSGSAALTTSTICCSCALPSSAFCFTSRTILSPQSVSHRSVRGCSRLAARACAWRGGAVHEVGGVPRGACSGDGEGSMHMKRKAWATAMQRLNERNCDHASMHAAAHPSWSW
jgi:hypothetical protein